MSVTNLADAADEARRQGRRPKKTAAQLRQEADEAQALAKARKQDVEDLTAQYDQMREAIKQARKAARQAQKESQKARSAAESVEARGRETSRLIIAGRWLLNLTGTVYEEQSESEKKSTKKTKEPTPEEKVRLKRIEAAKKQWGEEARAIVRAMMDTGYLTTDADRDVFLTAAERKAKAAKVAEKQAEQAETPEQVEQAEQQIGRAHV